jgi:hypothetical protein
VHTRIKWSILLTPSIHHLQESHCLSNPTPTTADTSDTFNFRVMATVARYIRSHYDPETEREDLLLETGQTRASTSSGHGRVRGGIGFFSGGEEGGRNVDDGDQEELEVDPWLVELPYAPAKLNPLPKFVKSVLSYEDVNDYIERGYESGLLGRDEEKDEDVEEEGERDFELVSESE